MEERIFKLLEKLRGLREKTLAFYLEELEKFTPNDGRETARHRERILLDLDNHISNLEDELKRKNLEVANA
jgi:hypothetical protein